MTTRRAPGESGFSGPPVLVAEVALLPGGLLGTLEKGRPERLKDNAPITGPPRLPSGPNRSLGSSCYLSPAPVTLFSSLNDARNVVSCPPTPENTGSLTNVYADDGISEQEETLGHDADALVEDGDAPAEAESALAEDDPEETEPNLTDDEPGEDEAASLEDLVARRAAALGRGEEVEDDPEELIELRPQSAAIRSADPLPTKVVPIRARREFVCNRCHLVKARSQLADGDRGLCRDCI